MCHVITDVIGFWYKANTTPIGKLIAIHIKALNRITWLLVTWCTVGAKSTIEKLLKLLNTRSGQRKSREQLRGPLSRARLSPAWKLIATVVWTRSGAQGSHVTEKCKLFSYDSKSCNGALIISHVTSVWSANAEQMSRACHVTAAVLNFSFLYFSLVVLRRSENSRIDCGCPRRSYKLGQKTVLFENTIRTEWCFAEWDRKITWRYYLSFTDFVGRGPIKKKK